MVARGGSVLPSRFPDETFELYSIAAHDRGGSEFILGSEIGSAKQVVAPDDILISKIVPHIRRARRVGKQLGHRQIASGEWIVLRHPEIYPDYLRHFLLSDSFHASFMNTVAGVGGSLMRARPEHVRKIQIPLPPMDEQRRIAEILDQADELRAKRRQVLAHLDALPQAVFQRLFKVESSSSWPRVKLGEISRIVRGASPRPAGDPRYFGGDIPWLKISDITATRGPVVQRIRETVTEEGRARSVLIPAETLILTNSATVGVAKIIGPSTCIHDGFLAFLDVSSSVMTRWLQAALESLRTQLVALAPEGTQKNLNGPIVKAVEISLPPLALQAQFVSFLDAVSMSELSSTAAFAEAEALFASLQFRAFKGEL